MAAQGTALEILDRDIPNDIDYILNAERAQGCKIAPGAYERIKAALIEAIEREVTCGSEH